MSRLAFLVIGLAAGTALGLLWTSKAREPRARAGARPDEPPRRDARIAPDEAPPPLEDPPPPPPAPPRASEPREDLLPATPLSGGFGRLEVDRGGRPLDVWVRGRDMWGDSSEVGFGDPVDGMLRMDLKPGDYEVVWWEETGLSECVRRARVEAGLVTRIELGADVTAEDFAIPDRLARLEVAVEGMDGSPRAETEVVVTGPSMNMVDETGETTSEDGRVRFHLAPGRYTVSLGTRRVPIDLLEGETTVVELRYDREGEIDVEPLGHAGTILFQARRRGGPPDDWIGGQNDGTVFVFLAPGEYEVALTDGRVVGTAAVQPRRVTPFPWQVPAGQIVLVVRSVLEPPRGAKLELVSLGAARLPAGFAAPVHWRREGEEFLAGARVAHLEPGRYAARLVAEGFLPDRREVEVGGGALDLELHLAPDPAAPRER